MEPKERRGQLLNEFTTTSNKDTREESISDGISSAESKPIEHRMNIEEKRMESPSNESMHLDPKEK